MIRRNKIANVGYVVIERKQSYNKRMKQICTKEYKTRHKLDGEGNSLEIVQEIENWPYKQMVYAQTRISLWETDHLISDRRPDIVIVKKKKKRTSRIVDFIVPAVYRVKFKESEKRDKYFDLASELKKTWNNVYTEQSPLPL